MDADQSTPTSLATERSLMRCVLVLRLPGESASVPLARPSGGQQPSWWRRAIRVAGRASRCRSRGEGRPTGETVSPTVSPTRHFW